jgi:hypothetical protein
MADEKITTENRHQPQTITQLCERLREDGWAEIADAIADGRIDELSHFQTVIIDTAVYGFGVLVEGERVDPLGVKILAYSKRDDSDTLPVPKRRDPIPPSREETLREGIIRIEGEQPS